MIEYLNKTVFNSNCDAIVNTVNCVGVMGTGLALEFALRYPDLKKQYELDCKDKKVKIGEIISYKTSDAIVLNFPTKIHWKYPSKLEWIEKGLNFIVENYKKWNIKSIAIPPLGCNNGGLDYIHQVKPLIESKLNKLEIRVCLCQDPGIAEGKEKNMVDSFNSSNIEELCDKLKIKGKARTSLLKSDNISRFYEIKNIENVGIATYEKLFNFFYNEESLVHGFTQMKLDI